MGEINNSWLTEYRNGVYYLTEPKAKFEEAYISVRQKEDRVHTDDFVKKLPETNENHLHFIEWNKRKWTADKFITSLKEDKSQVILEVGCGNGWFSNQLLSGSNQVFGLDVGATELEQAARCFSTDNIKFLCCDDLTKLPSLFFDVIVFNASLQYFNLDDLFWDNLSRCLKPKGQIEILDSPFYTEEDIVDARKRSDDYFTSIQQKEAREYYRHLGWNKLPKTAVVKYRPNKWLNKFFSNRSPFPWVSIQKLS